jgi:taurine dioxygenase
MKIEPGTPFGATVTDVDVKLLAPGQADRLVQALAEHHVLLIKDQHLEKRDYDAFGRRFGDPIDFFFTRDLDDEFPALITISNDPGLDVARRDGAAFWHTDGSYEHVPAGVTMLYALEAPAEGGETRFADLAAAYDALPSETRERIDELKACHMLLGGKRDADETPIKLNPDAADRDGGIRARKRATERPVHPLVRRHPITGRSGLYAIAGTPFAIEGMQDAESAALLSELKTHATSERFVRAFKADTHDILIWDNLSTMHRATPIEYTLEPGRCRRLLRFSTKSLKLTA